MSVVPLAAPIRVPVLPGLSSGMVPAVRPTVPVRTTLPAQVLVPAWLTRAPWGRAPLLPKPVPLRVSGLPPTVTPPDSWSVAPLLTVTAPPPAAEDRPRALPFWTLRMPSLTTVCPVAVLREARASVPPPTLVRSPPPLMPPTVMPLMRLLPWTVVALTVSVLPASTPMELLPFRMMLPDQVLLPPARLRRAPRLPTPVPLRTIDLVMLRP